MLRRIHDPERGASLIEYAATIVLAAAILAGLINVGITTSITGGVTGALEKLTVPDEGDPVGGSPGRTSGAPGPDPQSPGSGTGSQPQDGGAGPGNSRSGGGSASKDTEKGGGAGGQGGALPGINMTSIGIGGPFNPGVNLLEGVGGKNWFDDLSNHDVWLDPEEHLPEIYGTDLFPSTIPIRLGLQEFGFDKSDFGWLGEQYAESNKMLGDLWKDMAAGGVNTVLHPQQMFEAARDGATKAFLGHADGLSEIVIRNLEQSNGSLFGAVAGSMNGTLSYNGWKGPLSPSRLLVDQAARNDCARGDYGKCAARVGMSVVELLPIAKGPSIAGKLSKGLQKPGPTKPKGPSSRRPPGHVEAGGNRKGMGPEDKTGGDPPNPSCTKPNSFLPGTPVLLAGGTTIPIEDVEVGDKVHAFDPRTGVEGPRPVTHLIRGQGTKTLVTISVTDQGGRTGRVTATDEHPFWDPKRAQWVDAIDLVPGTWLRTSSGSWAQVTAARTHESANQEVRNLTVADLHTYHVGSDATSLLVHNCPEDLDAIEDHVVPRHTRGGAEANASKTLFDDGVDLEKLAEGSTGQIGKRQSATGNIRYFIRSKKIVGVDRSGNPTNVYTIVRDGRDGYLITMHPGLPRDAPEGPR